jgi:hypothetical protein
VENIVDEYISGRGDKSSGEISERCARKLVHYMYHHTPKGVVRGEYFTYTKAEEVQKTYGLKSVPVSEIYVAINAQFHDYNETISSWFNGKNVDNYIIDSAVVFWFKDEDYKHRSKVYKYFIG